MFLFDADLAILLDVGPTIGFSSVLGGASWIMEGLLVFSGKVGAKGGQVWQQIIRYRYCSHGRVGSGRDRDPVSFSPFDGGSMNFLFW